MFNLSDTGKQETYESKRYVCKYNSNALIQTYKPLI